MTSWPARTLVLRLLVGLTALGVALALIGLFVLPNLGGSGDDDTQSNEVISRANDFAVTYNTYDVANLKDYQGRLKSLLTPTYDAQFVKITDAVFGALTEKKQQSGSAKVLGVAVDSIDDDSADAIVAVDASITNTDNAAAVLRHFRWKVSFTKTKGEWLVSNFESIASVDAQAVTPAPTPAPGAAPTPSPTPAEGDAP